MCDKIEKEGIVISASHIQAIIAHADTAYPMEVCGFVAGFGNTVDRVIPIANIFKSPDRFLMDPHQQIVILSMIESQGMTLLGIYHSHPDGAETPSMLDIEEYQYPGVLIIICHGNPNKWNIHCYKVIDTAHKLVPMMVVNDRDSYP